MINLLSWVILMQSNTLIAEMQNEIEKAHYILLVTDKSFSIDSIASSLALSNYFYESKIKHKVYNPYSVLPRKLNFLPKFDKISKDIPKYYDLVIYFDCTDEYKNEVKNISIDSSKVSISEFLYLYLKINKLQISKNIAECLYVGLYSASLGFTTIKNNSEIFTIVSDLLKSNINVAEISDHLLQRESLAKFKIIPKVMNSLELFSEGKLATVYLDETWIKETGVEVSECDDIIDMVLSIGIVEVTAYFRIIKNQVSVLLRSKKSIDLSFIASKFNGNGTKNHVSFSTTSSSIVEVKEKVVQTILNYI